MIAFFRICKFLFVCTLFLTGALSPDAFGQCQTSGHGNWEDPAIWTNCGGGIPGSGSAVTIRHNIVSNANHTVASITYASVGQPRSLTVSSDTITVTGNYNTQTGSASTINVGASLVVGGTLTSNVAFNVNGTLQAGTLNPRAGTFNINATGTVNVVNTLNISNGPVNVNVFGTMNAQNLTISGGGTFLNVRNGGNTNITNNATLSGSGIINVDFGGYVGVGNNLNITGGTDVILNGNMDISGNLHFESNGNTVSGSNTGCIYYSTISCPAFIINNGGTCEGTLISGVCLAMAPLPLDWVSFEAAYAPAMDLVQLAWATANEEGNSLFEIERSTDGSSFSKIGEVPGQKDHREFSYSFSDMFPVSGPAYYRVKQVDVDGRSSYSAVRAVNIARKGQSGGSTIRYIGSRNQLEVMLTGETDQTVALVISDLSGRRLYDMESTADAKRGRVFWDISLNRGMYIVSVYSANGNVFSKTVPVGY